MNKFVVQPLEKKMNRQNPITRLEKAERAAGVKPSESVGALAELSSATGDLDVIGTLRIVDPETGEVQIREGNDGIAIETPATESTFNAYRFEDSENILSYMAGYTGGGLGAYLAIKALGDTPASSPGNADINIRAYSSSNPLANAKVLIEAIHAGTPGPAIGLYGGAEKIILNANPSDVDIQIKSSTDTYFSYWDSGLHAIGLGQNASSDYFLSIGGDVNLSSGHKYYIDGVEVGTAGSPITCNMLTRGADSVGQGTWAAGTSSNFPYNGRYINLASDANGDNFTVNFWLPAGTYTLRFNSSKQPDRAIVKVEVGSTNLGNSDRYAASADYLAVAEYTGITISTPGIYAVRFTVNGRHASATHYYFDVSEIEFIRTA